MKKLPDFFQLDAYNISEVDVTQMVFHCEPLAIQPDVILMPCWQPTIFDMWIEKITTITPEILYEVEYQGKPISIIRSGIGAAQTGDAVLALGCTPCQRILFAGSAGGLRPDINIGDLILPEFSYAGDGFCRYLEPGFPKKDCFLEHTMPDQALAETLKRVAAPLAQAAGVAIHTGPVFSIDSILAQFNSLGRIAGSSGCAAIEMESAATFKAAHMVGIQAAALLSVSDAPIKKQTLYAGRSEAEKGYRRETRRNVLAKALLDTFIAL